MLKAPGFNAEQAIFKSLLLTPLSNHLASTALQQQFLGIPNPFDCKGRCDIAADGCYATNAAAAICEVGRIACYKYCDS